MASWDGSPQSPIKLLAGWLFSLLLLVRLAIRTFSFFFKMSYFYGSGGGQRQPKWNYQPNLDSSLLATVRDEMLRKEEEYRREQQRLDTEKRKLTSYLTQLQAMVRDLPG